MPKLDKDVGDFVVSDREVPSVDVGDSVADAVAKMKAMKAESVVVLSDGAISGVFTERDFLNRIAGPGLAPADTPVRDVMTKDPETLALHDSISYAINKMAVGGFRHVPIVKDSAVVAVLSAGDVIGHLFDLFAEASERDSVEINPWTDVGGG